MPALQNFVNLVSTVSASWLNQVDVLLTTVFQQAATNPTARAALCSDLPLEIVNGGTAARDAADALSNLGGLPAALFTPGQIGGLISPILPSEVGVVNVWIPYGWVQRYGAVDDSGVTNNQTAFQNALTSSAGNFPVVVCPMGTGYFGGFTGPLSVPANSQIQFRNAAELRWASASATGPTYSGGPTAPGLNLIGGNIRIEGKGILSGPSGPGVYTSNEIGIICIGASAAAPIVGVYIGPQLEIRWWGSDGIVLKYVNDLNISGNTIHDCGYAGAHILTATRGAFQNNEIYNIIPGNPGPLNAYGVSFTFEGSPNNLRSDPNHFCIGMDVSGNFVHDVPGWIGIDFHGAFDSDVHDNRVYNCWTAIQVASGNNFGGENNSIVNNVCNVNQYNGAASTVSNPNPMGITVNGGSSSNHIAPRIIGNVIVGYGSTPIASYSIQATNVDSPVISDNVFRAWAGVGIYTGAGIGGVISGNVFQFLSATTANDACILIANCNTTWEIYGNMHRVSSGLSANFGVSLNTSVVANIRIGTNDFNTVQTAAYGNTVGGVLANAVFLPSDYPPGWNGVIVPTQVTGFGNPSGSTVVNNFPGATATLVQTSQTVAEILTVLKGLGLIGT